MILSKYGQSSRKSLLLRLFLLLLKEWGCSCRLDSPQTHACLNLIIALLVLFRRWSHKRTLNIFEWSVQLRLHLHCSLLQASMKPHKATTATAKGNSIPNQSVLDHGWSSLVEAPLAPPTGCHRCRPALYDLRPAKSITNKWVDQHDLRGIQNI